MVTNLRTPAAPAICCILALLGLLAGSARADIPGQNDPKCYTAAQYNRDLYAFNVATTVEPYKKIGKTSPQWDQQAIKFLDAMAVYFTYKTAPALSLAPPTPKLPEALEMLALGKAAVDAGCDDPLVLYYYARVLDMNDQHREAHILYPKANIMMEKTDYPPLRKYFAAHQVYGSSDSTPDGAPDVFRWAAKSMTEESLQGLGPRAPSIVSRMLGDWVELCEGSRVGAELLRVAAKENKPHPYVLAVVGGRYHLVAAWATQGYGTWMDVNKPGIMAEHLTEARKMLEAASKDYPQFPEAPTLMMSVEHGQTGSTGEPVRDWFDRAAKAQFDYAPAYFLRLWIFNRAGSLQDTQAFGLECLKTKRFDTQVPFVYIDALKDITDQSLSWACWERPGVYKNLMDMTGSYLAVQKAPTTARWLRSYQLALAVKFEHLDEVPAKLAAVQNDLDTQPFLALKLIPARDVPRAQALGGPSVKVLLRAEKLAHDQHLDEALAAYRNVLTAPAKETPDQRYADRRIQELTMLKKFLAGEIVDLQPAGDLGPWIPVGGKWTVDKDGALVGQSGPDGLILLHPADFGKRYEMTGHVQVKAPLSSLELSSWLSFLHGAHGGPIPAFADSLNYYGCWLYSSQRSGFVGMVDGYNHIKSYTARVTGDDDFGIEVWDSAVAANVNGKPIFHGYVMEHSLGQMDTRLGVGGCYKAAGATVTFTNLKLRRLKERPEWLDEH